MLKHFPIPSQEQQLMCSDNCWRGPNTNCWAAAQVSQKALVNNYIMLNVYELTIITKWVNCAARKMGWKVACSSSQQMARNSSWLCCNSCIPQ